MTSQESLSWILDSLGKYITKEETLSNLPNWKVDINNDFGHNLVDYEDGALLTPLVRLSYLQYLRFSLKNNYLQCHKGIKDCNDTIVKRIENCAVLMEQKALRLCMIASFYQRTMTSIISEIKNLTNNNLLHKELGKCLCSDYVSFRHDKNIQTDFRPLKLSRGVQTSNYRPWTETNIDTLQTWKVTKQSYKNRKIKDGLSSSNSKANQIFDHSSSVHSSKLINVSNSSEITRIPSIVPNPNNDNKYLHSSSQISSNAYSQEAFQPVISDFMNELSAPEYNPVNNCSNNQENNYDLFTCFNESTPAQNDYDSAWAPCYVQSNISRPNLISIEPIDLEYSTDVKNTNIKQIIDNEILSMATEDLQEKRKSEDDCNNLSKHLKNEDIHNEKNFSPVSESKSKTYDSLDDRLQELFADKFDRNKTDTNFEKPKQKSIEEVTKELLGSDDDDDDDDPLKNNEAPLDFSDNDHEVRSSDGLSDELDELLKEDKNITNFSLQEKSLVKEEDKAAVDESLVNTKFDPNSNMKPYFISWLSERVAQVCYFNSLMQKVNPERRKILEHKFVQLFGPCCMFDNDDFTPEEQRKICQKRIAKIVCHYLRPFFRSKKIVSKKLFQIIARHMTDHFLKEHIGAGEKMVKKYIEKFFAKNGKIKSVKNLPFAVNSKSTLFDA